jgi:hypothetical protein
LRSRLYEIGAVRQEQVDESGFMTLSVEITVRELESLLKQENVLFSDVQLHSGSDHNLETDDENTGADRESALLESAPSTGLASVDS